MAAGVMSVLHIADGVLDDEEISFLYEIKAPLKNGTSKSEAIVVEDYTLGSKGFAGSSKKSVYFDGEVELLLSAPSIKKRVYRGESSNSKTVKDTPLTFMCEICVDEKPKSDLFRKLGCKHSYCCDCIAKYVAARLQDNITTINCPVSGCCGVLKPYNCGSTLPKEVFDRWSDALCEAVILGAHKFYCPYKDCSALLVDDRNRDSEVIVQAECPHCNRSFCAECKVPWHNGIACSEFQKLGIDERGNEDIMLIYLAAKKKWKRCSNCRFFVEKSEGCLFMRCRCGHTFCYNCGTPKARNADHFVCNGCKR